MSGPEWSIPNGADGLPFYYYAMKTPGFLAENEKAGRRSYAGVSSSYSHIAFGTGAQPQAKDYELRDLFEAMLSSPRRAHDLHVCLHSSGRSACKPATGQFGEITVERGRYRAGLACRGPAWE